MNSGFDDFTWMDEDECFGDFNSLKAAATKNQDAARSTQPQNNGHCTQRNLTDSTLLNSTPSQSTFVFEPVITSSAYTPDVRSLFAPCALPTNEFDYSIFDDDFSEPVLKPPAPITSLKPPSKRPNALNDDLASENSTDYLLSLIKRSRVESGYDESATKTYQEASSPRFCSSTNQRRDQRLQADAERVDLGTNATQDLPSVSPAQRVDPLCGLAGNSFCAANQECDLSKSPPRVFLPNRFCSTTNKERELTTPPERVFPGPAGILPNKQNKSLDTTYVSRYDRELKFLDQKPTSLMWTPQTLREYDRYLSITEFSDFSHWPWTQMKSDMEHMPASGPELNLRELNIDWVLRSVRKNSLPNGKVPLLAVLVKSVSHNSCGADLTVKDTSCYMHVLVDKELTKQYKFEPGLGIIIRKMPVVAIGRTRLINGLLLPNCIAALYSKSEAEKDNFTRLSRDDFRALHSELSAWISTGDECQRNQTTDDDFDLFPDDDFDLTQVDVSDNASSNLDQESSELGAREHSTRLCSDLLVARCPESEIARCAEVRAAGPSTVAKFCDVEAARQFGLEVAGFKDNLGDFNGASVIAMGDSDSVLQNIDLNSLTLSGGMDDSNNSGGDLLGSAIGDKLSRLSRFAFVEDSDVF